MEQLRAAVDVPDSNRAVFAVAQQLAVTLPVNAQHVSGQLDNYSRLRQLKREIARLHTELRAREIAAAEALENTQKEDAS